jgi:hypothetical protein
MIVIEGSTCQLAGRIKEYQKAGSRDRKLSSTKEKRIEERFKGLI